MGRGARIVVTVLVAGTLAFAGSIAGVVAFASGVDWEETFEDCLVYGEAGECVDDTLTERTFASVLDVDEHWYLATDEDDGEPPDYVTIDVTFEEYGDKQVVSIETVDAATTPDPGDLVRIAYAEGDPETAALAADLDAILADRGSDQAQEANEAAVITAIVCVVLAVLVVVLGVLSVRRVPRTPRPVYPNVYGWGGYGQGYTQGYTQGYGAGGHGWAGQVGGYPVGPPGGVPGHPGPPAAPRLAFGSTPYAPFVAAPADSPPAAAAPAATPADSPPPAVSPVDGPPAATAPAASPVDGRPDDDADPAVWGRPC
ncbi:MAG: hypothetical protein GXX79_17195 [Actinomycetales bacterium]|nr:hypothetical protein [Actinomycetales bacterium]